MRAAVPTLLTLLTLVGALAACNSPKKHLVGLWQVKGGSDRIEFFQDGRVVLSPCSINVTGSWLVLDDGRVKIEASVMGTTNTMLGSMDDDELRINRRNTKTHYEKLPTGTSCNDRGVAGSEFSRYGDSPRLDDGTGQAVSKVKSDLRYLVPAEESFYADSGRYTSVISHLRYKAPEGVEVPQISASRSYWTAKTPVLAVPGMVCVIAVNTANPLLASAGDGEPACK